MWFRLYADEFFECRLDRAAGLVQLVRSAERFPDRAALATCFEGLETGLGLVPRERMGLLIDVRGGPTRVAPTLNDLFQRHRVTITDGFAAVAVVVRTATGGAQVRRISRGDAVEHRVFHEEEDAMRYLSEALRELRR